MPYKSVEARRKNHKKIRVRNRNFLVGYLKTNPCVDCGENDIRVLEFNHLDPNDKFKDVCKMVSSQHYSLEKIQTEISKCEVLCANCHRKKTMAQRAIWWADLD